MILTAFVAFVGYSAARSADRTRLRSLLYVGLVVVGVLLVLWVKSLVGH